jgi:hypothetical protein
MAEIGVIASQLPPNAEILVFTQNLAKVKRNHRRIRTFGTYVLSPKCHLCRTVNAYGRNYNDVMSERA